MALCLMVTIEPTQLSAELSEITYAPQQNQLFSLQIPSLFPKPAGDTTA
jgi:hypothetical protein